MSTLPADVESLLREAAEWRLLSVLFDYPTDGWRHRLSAVAANVREPMLRQAAEQALTEASEGVHHSIFGPGGPVSPREATYSNNIQLGYLLAELAAFYDAFAYTPRTPEPADHVAVEVGFIAYMRMKEACARAYGDAPSAQLTREAADLFIKDHLAASAEPIAVAMEPVGPPYLVLASRVLLERAGARPTSLVVLDPDGCAETATCSESI